MGFYEPPEITPGRRCRTSSTGVVIFRQEAPLLHFDFYRALGNFWPSVHRSSKIAAPIIIGNSDFPFLLGFAMRNSKGDSRFAPLHNGIGKSGKCTLMFWEGPEEEHS